MGQDTVTNLLEALRILVWPVTIVTLVILFRAQLRERLGSLRQAELPGGIRLQLDALQKEVTSTPEVEASRIATSDTVSADGTTASDRLYAVAGVRVDLDRMLRRLSKAATRDKDFATRDLTEIILDLRDAGELSAPVARQVQSFMRLANASFADVDVSDDDIVALLTVGSLLTAHVHYQERVASITTDHWGHDLAFHLMHLNRSKDPSVRGGEDERAGPGWWQASDGKWYPPPNPKEKWAVIATVMPDVDYNFQLFHDALRRAMANDEDRNWPRQDSPRFVLFEVTRREFLEIAKFRRDELRRLLREGEGHWWEDGSSSQEWRYYQWPTAWGEIQFNQPVSRDRPDEVADDLLHAEAAVRRLRAELDDV